jgi:TIR domain-containing protein
MEVLDTIVIQSGTNQRVIELCFGDLTAVPPEHAVDALIVSAFPNDYQTTATSLIGALRNKGISVAELARNKAVDLRDAFSCWLSPEIVHRPEGVPYSRILCFEPARRGRPPEMVGDIFRALAPFLAGPPGIRTVAMPVVAAGDQGYGLPAMLEPLLVAAATWMKTGLPLQRLKIVVFPRYMVDQALRSFSAFKRSHTASAPARQHRTDYDVFVSYARVDAEPVDALVAYLKSASLSLFVDRLELTVGESWQPRIFEAIDRCKRLVAFYSPAYVASKVCQEEFNIAWARGRQLGTNTILPVYWSSADLPTYMSMLSFVDCREQRRDDLRLAAEQLAAACAH